MTMGNDRQSVSLQAVTRLEAARLLTAPAVGERGLGGVPTWMHAAPQAWDDEEDDAADEEEEEDDFLPDDEEEDEDDFDDDEDDEDDEDDDAL